MTYDWNGDYSRFDIASNILLQIVDSIYQYNNEVEFAVRMYGTLYPAQDENCSDTRLEVPFNLQNVNQIKQKLKYVRPIGSSPIAYSLEQAASMEINQEAKYDYSLIFISDGGESCGGDICAMYSKLLEKKLSITPYIIGLDKNEFLQSYYDCLGKFVPVLTVEDIPKAVHLIVEENRTIIEKPESLGLKTVYSNTVIKKETLPVKKVKEAVVKEPVVKKDEPKPIIVQRKPSRQIYTLRSLKSPKPSTSGVLSYKVLRPIRSFRPVNINWDFEVAPKRQALKAAPKLNTMAPRYRYSYAYKLKKLPLITTFQPVNLAFTYEDVKKRVTKVTVVNNGERPAGGSFLRNDGELTFSVESVPDENTLVQVFFVNRRTGKAKFFRTTPQIIVKQASDGKEVAKFIRRLNGNNPIPQEAKSGLYDFVVKGKQFLWARNVNLQPNMLNKVYINVDDGTLAFVYEGNRDRSVTEYEAIVNRRFDNRKNPTVIQACSEIKRYDPGTYYVEIKTTPVMKWSIELDFGGVYELPIPEPGTLIISNTNRLGEIVFSKPLGDSYENFLVKDIEGRTAEQSIEILPGSYEVEFLKNPDLPELGTKTMKFRIYSNRETSLLLK